MSIKVTGITEVTMAFEGAVKGYKGQVTSFLRSEGNKLKGRIKDKARSRIKTKTGNYLNGVTAQKPYEYFKSKGTGANDSVKVYGKRPPAYHTHLIEEGHEKWLWGNRTADRVRAFYIYRDSAKEYEEEFERNAEAFVNKIISNL